MKRIEELTFAIHALTIAITGMKNSGPAVAVAADVEEVVEAITAPPPAEKKRRRQATLVAQKASKGEAEPKSEPKSEPEPELEPADRWSHADATAWVVDLSAKNGSVAEIVKIIKGFGVNKVSDIPVEQLPKFRVAVEALYE